MADAKPMTDEQLQQLINKNRFLSDGQAHNICLLVRDLQLVRGEVERLREENERLMDAYKGSLGFRDESHQEHAKGSGGE